MNRGEPQRRNNVAPPRVTPHKSTPMEEKAMLNIDDQSTRVERLYRQITGTEAKRMEKPYAPIPPDANPEQYVTEQMQRLENLLQVAGVTVSGMAPAAVLPTFAPRIAVYESDKEWRCAVELPGVKKTDLAVQILQGTLRVAASRGLPFAEDGQRPVYSEIIPSRFERTVVLPPFVKAESAEARFDGGILAVRFQKEPLAIRRDLKIEVA